MALIHYKWNIEMMGCYRICRLLLVGSERVDEQSRVVVWWEAGKAGWEVEKGKVGWQGGKQV